MEGQKGSVMLRPINKADNREEYNDTLITFDMMRCFPDEYQAHLERITDFLIEKNIWEATQEGVKLFDVSGIFRS